MFSERWIVPSLLTTAVLFLAITASIPLVPSPWNFATVMVGGFLALTLTVLAFTRHPNKYDLITKIFVLTIGVSEIVVVTLSTLMAFRNPPNLNALTGMQVLEILSLVVWFILNLFFTSRYR